MKRPVGVESKAIKKKDASDDLYWRVKDDEFELVRDNQTSLVRFTVRGNPRPLKRHRTSRGFM
jgi:hypothetical protein